MSIEPSGEEIDGHPAPPSGRARYWSGSPGGGLGLDAEVRVEEDAEEITAEFVGDDLGQLTGHHGAVIDSIQHLTYRIVFHGLLRRAEKRDLGRRRGLPRAPCEDLVCAGRPGGRIGNPGGAASGARADGRIRAARRP